MQYTMILSLQAQVRSTQLRAVVVAGSTAVLRFPEHFKSTKVQTTTASMGQQG